MAKGMFGGVLGGEEEEKTAPARAGTEAFAAAVALWAECGTLCIARCAYCRINR
jgi:hypothetical protein